MRKTLLALLFITVLQGQSGYDIAKMMDERKQPTDMTSKTTMVLTNSKGKTRTSTIFSQLVDSGNKQILWFLAPADDKGVAFLKIEHDDKDDEMRMWLPAFNKIRRISSKKKGDSFMGSDLSYEDMTSRELDENEFVRLDDDEVDGKECYMLEVTPKPEAKSNYSKHMTWVEKATLLAVKEESYDQNGNLKKTKVFNTSRMGDYNIMTGIFVKDVQKEHTTRVTFDEIQLDSGLEENLFQEKNLKRMPRLEK
ncbi:MAG: hypothetical protein CMF77_00305 [Candidatus Marinimicrobia bacterium]|nr:hypothetical protein [Candidatus Neomarinimicrobiota bacterium]